MNRTLVIRGIVTVTTSLAMLGFWFLMRGQLPISAYSVVQYILLPTILFFLCWGSIQLYHGLKTNRRKAVVPVPEELRRLVQVISDEEAERLEAEITVGSPFAEGTALPLEMVGEEIDFEAGVWRETALGGLLASVIMIAFGAGALTFFPFGAVLICGAGGILGAFALVSRKPYWGLTATVVNLALFAAALVKTLS